MANRFRKFIESIVYAGMAPGSRGGQAEARRRFLWVQRFLSGPAPTDPLYLTNRTFGQKLTRGLWIAVPLVVLVAGTLVGISFYAERQAKPAKDLTPAEIAAKILPNFNKDLSVESNRDIQVLDVHFDHAGTDQMVGSLQNKTDHVIREAVVVFDLTDSSGSQLGGVTVQQSDLAPGAVRPFKLAIEQKTAVSGLVREVRTH